MNFSQKIANWCFPPAILMASILAQSVSLCCHINNLFLTHKLQGYEGILVETKSKSTSKSWNVNVIQKKKVICKNCKNCFINSHPKVQMFRYTKSLSAYNFREHYTYSNRFKTLSFVINNKMITLYCLGSDYFNTRGW